MSRFVSSISTMQTRGGYETHRSAVVPLWMLAAVAVRLRGLAGVLGRRGGRRRELEIERGLGPGHQVVHGCDRAGHRRPAGPGRLPLQLGKRAFPVGDVLIECRVRAALELRRLLPEVLQRNGVATA